MKPSKYIFDDLIITNDRICINSTFFRTISKLEIVFRFFLVLFFIKNISFDFRIDFFI